MLKIGRTRAYGSLQKCVLVLFSIALCFINSIKLGVRILALNDFQNALKGNAMHTFKMSQRTFFRTVQ